MNDPDARRGPVPDNDAGSERSASTAGTSGTSAGKGAGKGPGKGGKPAPEAVAPTTPRGSKPGISSTSRAKKDKKDKEKPAAPALVEPAQTPIDELPKDAYVVALPTFEGPLDLLLHLIQKHELDILDIPVSFITEKYLTYLNMMKELTIDVASEYLVMAATLTHIKSKMLLPEVPKDQGDGTEEEEEDPRAELVRRLLEYQKYKAAAEDLGRLDALGKDVFPRGAAEPIEEGPAPFAAFGVFDLLSAFSKILEKTKGKVEHEVVFDRISITDRIMELTEVLKSRRSVPFEELFGIVVEDAAAAATPSVLEPRRPNRFDIVITFLAVLEMCRLKMMKVYQAEALSTIHVELLVLDEDESSRSDEPFIEPAEKPRTTSKSSSRAARSEETDGAPTDGDVEADSDAPDGDAPNGDAPDGDVEAEAEDRLEEMSLDDVISREAIESAGAAYADGAAVADEVGDTATLEEVIAEQALVDEAVAEEAVAEEAVAEEAVAEEAVAEEAVAEEAVAEEAVAEEAVAEEAVAEEAVAEEAVAEEAVAEEAVAEEALASDGARSLMDPAGDADQPVEMAIAEVVDEELAESEPTLGDDAAAEGSAAEPAAADDALTDEPAAEAVFAEEVGTQEIAEEPAFAAEPAFAEDPAVAVEPAVVEEPAAVAEHTPEEVGSVVADDALAHDSGADESRTDDPSIASAPGPDATADEAHADVSDENASADHVSAPDAERSDVSGAEVDDREADRASDSPEAGDEPRLDPAAAPVEPTEADERAPKETDDE